ncbi:hypothetical protein [Bacillus amyloliquefaciens]
MAERKLKQTAESDTDCSLGSTPVLVMELIFFYHRIVSFSELG